MRFLSTEIDSSNVIFGANWAASCVWITSRLADTWLSRALKDFVLAGSSLALVCTARGRGEVCQAHTGGARRASQNMPKNCHACVRAHICRSMRAENHDDLLHLLCDLALDHHQRRVCLAIQSFEPLPNLRNLARFSIKLGNCNHVRAHVHKTPRRTHLC